MGDERNERSQLGERLRLARKYSGLSQEAVAKRLNLQRPAISEIEAGRRRVSATELATLSDLYHTSMEWLMSAEAVAPNKLEVAARSLARLKPEDLEEILKLLNALRDPDKK